MHIQDDSEADWQGSFTSNRPKDFPDTSHQTSSPHPIKFSRPILDEPIYEGRKCKNKSVCSKERLRVRREDEGNFTSIYSLTMISSGPKRNVFDCIK